MIDFKKEDLLKSTTDYEDYSDNICSLTIDELRAEGLIKCGGCCSTKGGCSCGSSGGCH